MTEYENRVTRTTLAPKDDPIFSEMATTIEIEDDASGELVSVSQHGGPGLGKIIISRDEWPALRDAIEEMLERCRP